MYDEVFSPSFGNRPSFLVGRSQLLSQLEQGLQSRPGSRERTVVVLGQRGSGKTVLLWELADRMRKQGFAVASPTIVADGMLERILKKLRGRLPAVRGRETAPRRRQRGRARLLGGHPTRGGGSGQKPPATARAAVPPAHRQRPRGAHPDR